MLFGKRWLVFGLLCVALSVANAGIRHVDLDELPILADYSVVASVKSASTHWDKRGLMIFTDYLLTVEEVVFGDVGSEIVMSIAGGTVNGKSVMVSHAPALEVGKTYLLFAHDKNYSVPLVGHEQGLFMVLPNRKAGIRELVDDQWRRLEVSSEGVWSRGKSVALGGDGVLRVVEGVSRSSAISPPDSVVLGFDGKPVVQSAVVTTPVPAADGGIAADLDGFIGYIRKRAASRAGGVL